MVFWGWGGGAGGWAKSPDNQNGSQNNRVKTVKTSIGKVRCCYTTRVEVMCKRNLSFLPPFLALQSPLPLPLSLSLSLHISLSLSLVLHHLFY